MHEPEDNRERRKTAASAPIRVLDRRPNFDSSSPEEASAQEAPEKRYPSFVAELEARARAAEGKLSEALDLLRRREAEAEEFRTRLRKEMEKRLRAQIDGFLSGFLEVLDSFDRGLAVSAEEPDSGALLEGFVKVRDQLFALLARQGVEPMNLVGTEYDPHLAEAVAVSSAETQVEDNRVLEEIRRGYLLEGRVLRPAQVRVARCLAPVPQETPRESQPSES